MAHLIELPQDDLANLENSQAKRFEKSQVINLYFCRTSRYNLTNVTKKIECKRNSFVLIQESLKITKKSDESIHFIYIFITSNIFTRTYG